MDDIEIHIRLLNEGTEVSRPTRAINIGDGLFRILPVPGYDTDDEEWEFAPGSVIRTERRSSELGDYLLAVKP
jgi:hypothetical protein